jgi:transcriptional regulator with XRE-family HTH domain
MFGAMFATLRRRMGLTQQEAADFLGVSKTTISWWEAGRSAPPVAKQKLHLLALAAWGVPEIRTQYAVPRDVTGRAVGDPSPVLNVLAGPRIGERLVDVPGVVNLGWGMDPLPPAQAARVWPTTAEAQRGVAPPVILNWDGQGIVVPGVTDDPDGRPLTAEAEGRRGGVVGEVPAVLRDDEF